SMASAGGELAADDLVARSARQRDPGIGLIVLLGGAGARRVGRLAVVLAGLGDAVALLHVALGLRRRRQRERRREGRGDGDACAVHAMLLERRTRPLFTLGGAHGVSHGGYRFDSHQSRYFDTMPDRF